MKREEDLRAAQFEKRSCGLECCAANACAYVRYSCILFYCVFNHCNIILLGAFPNRTTWLACVAFTFCLHSVVDAAGVTCLRASGTSTVTLSDLSLNLTTTPVSFRHANLYMALNVVRTGRGQEKMHTVELLRRATRKKCVGRTDKHTFSAARLPGWRMTVHSTQRHSPSSAIGARS